MKVKLRRSVTSEVLRIPEDMIQLNVQDIPFVNNVTYLGVTFDRMTTWRLHIERTVTKALHMYMRTYFLFKSERLNTNIRLTLYKVLIRSVMTCLAHLGVYSGWSPLEQHHLQKRVLHTIGNFDRCTLVCKMLMAFKIPYVYDCISKLFRMQVGVILNHQHSIVHGTG
jgi:hypothetical protein